MRIKVAPISLSIKILTSIVISMSTLFFVTAIFSLVMFIPFSIMLIVIFLCKGYAPQFYEFHNKDLTIYSNYGVKTIPDIKTCKKVIEPISLPLRLFGNGGCYSFSGIFWNKKLGIFRAYLTNTAYKNLVIVETEKHKILLSPENPEEFINTFAN